MSDSHLPIHNDFSDSPHSEFTASPDSLNEKAITSRHRYGWHSTVLGLLAVSLVSYILFFPLAQYLFQDLHSQQDTLKMELMPLWDSVRLRAMQSLSGLWFFVLGGCIGSFLNVVAYRLPRGESIISKPSSCPGCDTAIKLRDNIPVVGWLALGGRCRSCGVEINIRYPVVETMAGIVFFLFFVFQLATGSANVPGVVTPVRSGVVWIVFDPQWNHISLYLYHCLLVSIILAWALIDFDTQRLRGRVQAVAFAVILVPIVCSPDLLPAAWESFPTQAGVPQWLMAIGLSLLGGCVGLTLGWVCQRMLRDSMHAPSILAWIGMGLGWHAAVAVLLVTLFIRVITWLPLRILGISFLPLTFYLFLGFVVHHIFWQWSIESFSPYWPGTQATLLGWFVVLLAGVGLLTANFWATTANANLGTSQNALHVAGG